MMSGIGLGFRRDLAAYFTAEQYCRPSFIELAPENWMAVGGKWGAALKEITSLYPVLTHGLSLSIGSPEDLDWSFLKRVKQFLDLYDVKLYSEHLSFSKCENAHLYELLPIPFCEEAVQHVSRRIRTVQDYLERPIAIENVSYYTTLESEIDEATFINEVVKESGCLLLLDVNNVYVNSFNHRYDPYKFISRLPLERVAYIHMAGHYQESPELIIDTHGEAISEKVFDLFQWTLPRVRPCPILLERDFNFPEFEEISEELQKLNEIANRAWYQEEQHVSRV